MNYSEGLPPDTVKKSQSLYHHMIFPVIFPVIFPINPCKVCYEMCQAGRQHTTVCVTHVSRELLFIITLNPKEVCRTDLAWDYPGV